LAALVAAVVIRLGGSSAADPIASFVVAAILLFGALRLLRDATLVLLEAAPAHLPVAMVRRIVSGFPEVKGVRALHIWTLGAGHDAIVVHVASASPDTALGPSLAGRLRALLGVEYVSVQVEPEPGPQHVSRGQPT
jgi:cation diffusion facilitator family transporter